MTYKILVAEDDTDIQEVLRLYLVNSGFEVVSAYDGSEAYELMLSEKPDLALLDIMMPVINGYELTKKIREISNIPIIILSAMNADSDKILGLDIGADDYITKPFNPLEVIARIQSNLRRKYKLDSSAAEENGDMLTVGELKLDTKKFILYKNGEEIMLTPTEFKILSLFMEKPGMVFTKAQIYQRINGDFYETDDNTMMVHISKLRDKLGDNSKSPTYIKTVRGLGYKIEKKK
ncbi:MULTISPECIES: response regulator transcription factor [Ruminococcus]|jgi:DNA-binding response OmpR family regulator|nr:MULTISPECIES: response regulator transcription factor [Ruminococcus]MBQ6169688.1 response regulator transcription factor [Ruminococcus sp.]MBR1432356.1 response regulator transcription factor [Ruminococcus sp.]